MPAVWNVWPLSPQAATNYIPLPGETTNAPRDESPPPEYDFMTHTIGFASGDVKILHEGPSDEDLSEWTELLNSVDGKKVTS